MQCGATLRQQANQESERQALRSQLGAVQSQLLQISQRLERLQARLAQLESDDETQLAVSPPAPASQLVAEQPAGDAPVRSEQLSDATPAPAAPADAVPSQPAAPEADEARHAFTRPPDLERRTPSRDAATASAPGMPMREGADVTNAGPSFTRQHPRDPFAFLQRIDWEQVLGRNWLAIIGAVTLVLGIGFFLKLSLDNNWINDTGRVLLGFAAGAGLLVTGEFARQRVPRWSQAVTSGGAATLYLTIYAAFALYELIRPDVAFVLLAAVVALAGLLALRYNAMVIGILGIVGAFIAPVLLGQDLSDIRLVLPYILVVDLGILWISILRKWRFFLLLGWLGSYGVFTLAVAQYPDQHGLLMYAGLTGIFLIFAGATSLFHILWREVPKQFDIGLVAANAMAFFLLTIAILEDYGEWFGLIAFSLAVFYGLTAYAAAKRPGAPPHMAFITLPIALVFLTIAAPLQFDGALVSLSWGAQGAALVLTGFVLQRWLTRYFGLGVLGLAVLSLLAATASPTAENFTPVLNQQFLSIAFVAVAMGAAAYLYWRRQAELVEWEWYVPWALSIGANVLALVALSAEAYNFFRNLEHVNSLASHEARNGLLLTLTAVWGTYATGLLAVGFWRRMQLAHIAGMALIVFVILKLLVFDTSRVDLDLREFTPFLNVLFLTYPLLLLPLGLVLYRYRAEASAPRFYYEYYVPMVIALMNLAVVWALSVEAVHFFQGQDSQLQGTLSDASVTNGILLSLTLIWATFGTGLLAFGLWRCAALTHLGGLALLAVAILKLVLGDSQFVELAPKLFIPILNPLFLTYLAVLLPIVAVLYVFRRQRESLPAEEALPYLAFMFLLNLAALWGLTVETVHIFWGQAISAGGSLDSRGVASGMQMTITAVWTLYALALLVIGEWRKERFIQWGGLALGGLALGKLLLHDTIFVHLDANSFLPIINTQFLTFALMLGLLATMAVQLKRRRLPLPNLGVESLPKLGVEPLTVVLALANVVAIWALTQEVVDFFDFRAERFLEAGQRSLVLSQESAKHLSLTVLWAIYAIGVMAAGMALQSSRVRLAGMALLAVPLVKLFGYDVFLLDRVFRVVAFVTLGALLLVTGLAYQRYSHRLRGFLFGREEEAPNG